jgi:pimeloyl-ACP methyl ester carboxylesterase
MHDCQRGSVVLLFLLALSPTAYAQSQPCATPFHYGENDAAGHFATVNGIRLYYEIYGDGPPLLLIHGNGGSIWGARCQIAHFSRTYRVIAADSRAHGRSGDGNGRLTYEQMANDLAVLLSEVNVDSVDIIGQSDGGILALLLAIRYPSKVKKIVANSPNIRPDGQAGWNFPLQRQMRDQANAMIAKGDHSQNWSRIKRWNELMLMEPHIAVAALHGIQAPVLISGADDDAIKPEHLLEIYRNLPRAQLSIMPGTTHFLNQEEYERYNQMAERFLTSPFVRPSTKDVVEREIVKK